GLLRTLPGPERGDGLVEAVKHGAILDEGHLSAVERSLGGLLSAQPNVAAEVISASVRLKAKVVAADEREGGYRQILNFGHTIGHAVEAASGYRLSHGSAVALGMLAESEIGERLGVTAPGTKERLRGVLSGLVGHGPTPSGAAFREAEALEAGSPAAGAALLDDAVAFLVRDKKARGGRPRYVLLEELGRVAPGDGWTHDVPDDVAHEALRNALESR
ncbi:MAG: 3-dehydroquinate synthase, partial [Gemmatimonadetes bacterium]|nr:3-dehydroquinate synthase [Gemmatimonadota bacterium]